MRHIRHSILVINTTFIIFVYLALLTIKTCVNFVIKKTKINLKTYHLTSLFTFSYRHIMNKFYCYTGYTDWIPCKISKYFWRKSCYNVKTRQAFCRWRQLHTGVFFSFCTVPFWHRLHTLFFFFFFFIRLLLSQITCNKNGANYRHPFYLFFMIIL